MKAWECRPGLAPPCSSVLAPPWRSSGVVGGASGAAGAEPIGVGAGLKDVGVEGDAVDDRGDESGVGDDCPHSLNGRSETNATEAFSVSTPKSRCADRTGPAQTSTSSGADLRAQVAGYQLDALRHSEAERAPESGRVGRCLLVVLRVMTVSWAAVSVFARLSIPSLRSRPWWRADLDTVKLEYLTESKIRSTMDSCV